MTFVTFSSTPQVFEQSMFLFQHTCRSTASAPRTSAPTSASPATNTASPARPWWWSWRSTRSSSARPPRSASSGSTAGRLSARYSGCPCPRWVVLWRSTIIEIYRYQMSPKLHRNDFPGKKNFFKKFRNRKKGNFSWKTRVFLGFELFLKDDLQKNKKMSQGILIICKVMHFITTIIYRNFPGCLEK